MYQPDYLVYSERGRCRRFCLSDFRISLERRLVAAYGVLLQFPIGKYKRWPFDGYVHQAPGTRQLTGEVWNCVGDWRVA